MKRLFILLVFGAFLLSACAPAVQGLTQLPDEGRLLILQLVTAAVTYALLWLGDRFKIDLSGYTNAVAAALAPILVTIAEHFLGLIPPAFDNVVLTIIHLVILLIGSIGTFFLFRRKAPSLR